MTDATSVLVVDDEPSITDALSVALEKEGFQVSVAYDGIEAVDTFRAVNPDIVLLDVMLPRMSGLDVCRALRAESTVPIIMVSARDEELDTVVGLEVGADDYVTKPYKVRELIARVRAALRRAPVNASTLDVAVLELGAVAIEPERHEVRVSGNPVELTRKEFELLFLLAEHAGKVVSRSQILDRVWGIDYVGDSKTLDVHIRRLRAKIEDDVSNPKRIKTIRGVGYMLEVA